MVRLPLHTWLSLCIDAVLIVLCALHIPSLIDRAGTPFQAIDDRSLVRLTEILDAGACPGLRSGDQILDIDGQKLTTADALEFLANYHTVGDPIQVTAQREGGTVFSTTVRAIPFYRTSYWIIMASAALFTFCLGIFVLLARPHDLSAGYLHASMMSLGVVLLMAFEAITPHSAIGFVGSLLFFLSYISVAATFYLFTTLFPKHQPGRLRYRALAIYVPASIVVIGLSVTYWGAYARHSVELFLTYNIWYDVLHIVVLVLVGAGIVNFISSYRRATSRTERRKLQWVLWGLCIGPTPFLFLNMIPELFQPTGLVPEEYTLIPMAFIPATFAISVARHHLFDIEQVIQRTTAYALVLVVLLGIYVAIVTLVASMVGQMAAGAGGAILVGLLFEPVRTRVQRAVDRRFFRVRYSFREAQSRFMDEVKTCMDERSVAVLAVQQIGMFIPVERMGFCLYVPRENRLKLMAQSEFPFPEGVSIALAADSPLASQRRPIALDGVLEPGILHDQADPSAFARWNVALLVPILSGDSTVQGLLFLGRKKSGARFTPDDVGLLEMFAGEAGLALNRLRLQKELFEKEAESRRLEELNSLKSDFVSYVSHELRTPLTSIKMFTQLLRSREGKASGKAGEYLHIIEGETDRLGRMVSTILDAARIDQGRKEYQCAQIDLGEIGQRVMESMRYQLDMQQFCVRFQRPARPVWINADSDAVADAIMNLIGNSIKYSAEKKWVAVKVSKVPGCGTCSVEDHGVGISPEAIPHLFDKFYREPNHSGRVKGVGLGLSVVKHVMDAHGGTIQVHSIPGRGTRFTLSFPLFQIKPSATPGGTAL